jgi:GNAT superfamily N-acetyltransferase
MNTPDLNIVLAAIDGTWPAASVHNVGPWIIREGQGGDSRVSAATTDQNVTAGDLPSAEAAMRDLGQPPLFMIRDGQDDLDQMLAGAGYGIKDPVNLYLAPVDAIAIKRPPPVSTFEVWPPLAAQIEIWEQGGIGPDRIAVMHRAKGAKTTLLGRTNDRPAGATFVAAHGSIAMAHAVETAPDYRRRGLARHMMTAAAFWAQAQGRTHLAVLCTEANTGANALYSGMGFAQIGQYHYRIKESDR